MHVEHRSLLARTCTMPKPELMKMCDWYVVREDDGAFLGFKAHPAGNAKILAVAHIDYLCSGAVSMCDEVLIQSSALDDRAGVFAALTLLPLMGIEADVLLTDSEENGRSTVSMLGAGMLKNYNWILQLDRRGDDVVTYGFTEMVPVLEEFWPNHVERGACSCISKLENVTPVSAFNVGVGYVDEHGETCTLHWEVLERQMGVLQQFYARYKDHRFAREHREGETVAIRRAVAAERAAQQMTAYAYKHYPVVRLPGTEPVESRKARKRRTKLEAARAKKAANQAAEPHVLRVHGFALDELCDHCGGPIGPAGKFNIGALTACQWCYDDEKEVEKSFPTQETLFTLDDQWDPFKCDLCGRASDNLTQSKSSRFYCDMCYKTIYGVMP